MAETPEADDVFEDAVESDEDDNPLLRLRKEQLGLVPSDKCVSQPNADQPRPRDAFYAVSKSNKQMVENKRRGCLRLQKFSEADIAADDGVEAGALAASLLQTPFHFNNLGESDRTNVEKMASETETFDAMGLHEKLLANVGGRFARPTQVQKLCWALFRRAPPHDLFVQAPTGCGKTLGFLLPLLQHVLELKEAARAPPNTTRPLALILLHTKELAIQVATEATKLAWGTNVGVTYSVGEVISDRIGANGVDIFIGTVGRMESNFFQEGVDIRLKLDDCRYLVLDEADRLAADHTFATTCVRFARESRRRSAHAVRCCMFSATASHPHADLLRDPLELYVGDKNMPISTVVQRFVEVRSPAFNYQESEFAADAPHPLPHRRDALYAVLRAVERADAEGPRRLPRTIVFVRTRRATNALAIDLLQKGYLCGLTNGEIPMTLRHKTFTDFKRGRLDIVVSTDLLARGVNLGRVDLVINYNLPQCGLLLPDEYIHRVGRAGRLGNCGLAITFFDRHNDRDMAFFLKKVLDRADLPTPSFIQETINEEVDQFELNWLKNASDSKKVARAKRMVVVPKFYSELDETMEFM